MERLQKLMAAAGIDSRRHCEEMIRDGQVKVNGKVVTALPVLVDIQVDSVTVNGKKLHFEPKVYYLLNKPKKVICTNYDPNERKRAIDLLPGVKQRVYPVGRLDGDSQGLVLMTNDGELANMLTHPRYGVTKKYIAEIADRITGDDIEKLKRGFFIARRGRACMDRVKVIKRSHKCSLLEITLKEGRNRQIRRMLARLGYSVKQLNRIQFGPLGLKGVGVGNYRPLTRKEVDMLKKTARQSKNSQTDNKKHKSNQKNKRNDKRK